METPMRHLTLAENARLEQGDAETMAYFAAHLEKPCDECEAFLAQVDGPGLLDGHVDASLLSLAPRAASDAVVSAASSAEKDPAFSAIRRALESPPPAQRRTVRYVAPLLALAASIVLMVALGRQLGTVNGAGVEAMDAGVKSAGTSTLSLELRAALLPEGDGTEAREVADAETVSASGALLLRYHATERAHALLVVENRNGIQTLGEFTLDPGSHDLTLPSGDFASYDLSGERGEIRLSLVAAVRHLPSLDEATQALHNPQHTRNRSAATATIRVVVVEP